MAITTREIAAPNFTTSSAMFVDIPDATLNIPPSDGTRWLLLVNAYLGSTSLAFDGPEARYQLNGIERGIGGTESVEVGKPGPWQHFLVFDGTTESQRITFQLRDGAGGATTISHLHAVAIPIPTSADMQYLASDALAMVDTMEKPVASLSLNPATTDDYLVFLLANASESPGSADITISWYDENDVALDTTLKNPRGSRQSMLEIRRIAPTPPTETFTLEAVTADVLGAEVTYARALALRVAGLPSFAESTSTGYASTPSGPIEVNVLTAQVPLASKYVVFGSMRIDDNCAPVVATRGAHYNLDGAETIVAHLSGNCALDTQYGYLDLVTTRPTRFAAGISSGTGEIVEHRESTLFVMGVD